MTPYFNGFVNREMTAVRTSYLVHRTRLSVIFAKISRFLLSPINNPVNRVNPVNQGK